MNPLQNMLNDMIGTMKVVEPLQQEKYTQTLAKDLLLQLTRNIGLAYTTNETQLKGTVSMCFAIADEFASQAESRFESLRRNAESKLQSEIDANQQDNKKIENELPEAEPKTGE